MNDNLKLEFWTIFLKNIDTNKVSPTVAISARDNALNIVSNTIETTSQSAFIKQPVRLNYSSAIDDYGTNKLINNTNWTRFSREYSINVTSTGFTTRFKPYDPEIFLKQTARLNSIGLRTISAFTDIAGTALDIYNLTQSKSAGSIVVGTFGAAAGVVAAIPGIGSAAAIILSIISGVLGATSGLFQGSSQSPIQVVRGF